ncbi:MAG TPA: nuclear pore complex subunit [Cytophagales bacterium]|jgi:hypothetical protein|nr:nuclear pore complex subunit [Cytophagales bacterium]
MESLILQPSAHTPTVSLNAATGVCEFKGRSTPENSVEYYEPIYKWLDAYSANPCPTTTVNIQFEYFNTSSSKCILDVLKKFVKLHNAGQKVQINWFYEAEDDDMKEAGEDYCDILQIPFDIQAIE